MNKELDELFENYVDKYIKTKLIPKIDRAVIEAGFTISDIEDRKNKDPFDMICNFVQFVETEIKYTLPDEAYNSAEKVLKKHRALDLAINRAKMVLLRYNGLLAFSNFILSSSHCVSFMYNGGDNILIVEVVKFCDYFSTDAHIRAVWNYYWDEGWIVRKKVTKYDSYSKWLKAIQKIIED